MVPHSKPETEIRKEHKMKKFIISTVSILALATAAASAQVVTQPAAAAKAPVTKKLIKKVNGTNIPASMATSGEHEGNEGGFGGNEGGQGGEGGEGGEGGSDN